MTSVTLLAYAVLDPALVLEGAVWLVALRPSGDQGRSRLIGGRTSEQCFPRIVRNTQLYDLVPFGMGLACDF
jgi:hypothetical protein